MKLRPTLSSHFVSTISASRTLLVTFAQKQQQRRPNNFLSTMAMRELKADKKLFTPGPLTTSLTVKQAMLRDLGSRDKEFIETVKTIRQKLVEIGDPSGSGKFTTILLPGSGTYAVESVFANVVGNSNSKALVLSNGAYGDRLAKICQQARFAHTLLKYPENDFLPLDQIESHLREFGKDYSLVAFVHSETSSGVINQLSELARLIKFHTNAFVFVDAMSSFGAVPIDMGVDKVDFLVSSANKCLEGVPGFSYVLCNVDSLKSCKGRCLSLSLDLNEQLNGFESNGQFRFTPPTHTLLAFKRALEEFDDEGGLEGRKARYVENCRVIKDGMKELGFKEFLDDKRHSGYIITSFCYPNDKNFDFMQLYSKLSDKGHVLYPGKVISADCFRIGSIGRIFPEDCRNVLDDMKIVLSEMGVKTAV